LAGYVTNAQGQTTYQTSPGNTVAKDSVFDPLSKNYNAQVANSNGKISLGDLNSANANGLSSYYNGTNNSGTTNNPSYVAPTNSSAGVYTGGSSPSYYNQATTDQANAIKQAQDLATLKSTYDNQLASQLGTYNTQRGLITGQTASNNNQSSAQGMANADHIRTALAQMGLLQSGESASQQLTNDVGTGNSINANNLAGQNLDASFADKITAAQAQNAMDYNNAAYQYGRNAVGDAASAAALQQQANQWQQTFNQQQAQDTFNNGINQAGVTGYYNGIYYKNGVATDNPSSSPSSTPTSLPSSISSQYPGATNVVKTDNGYHFNTPSGGLVYYVG
jgi:hypothetical protein